MLHGALDSAKIHETQRHLDELWRGRIDLFTSGTTKTSFIQHISNCAQSIIGWDLSVFLDYQDDVQGDFKMIYGKMDLKFTAGS